jgi:enoyl-CoA hydratase/carnithine racemase
MRSMSQIQTELVTSLQSITNAGVATVTLHRPAARNALDSEVVENLAVEFARLNADDSVRAVVLTGSPPGFCAGSDVRELAGMPVAEIARHEARTGQVVRSIQQLDKPVVAAVEGFALGGGFLLALGCDLVVTSSDARWQLPEVPLGWVPPWGLAALIARGGPILARRLAWGDRALTGDDVASLGLADEVSRPGDALDTALEIGSRLAELPAHAVTSTKRALCSATLAGAEALDSQTTWMFAQDCETDTAQHSLQRFAMKSPKENR